ncbi:MAG: ABC transporter ATP-binding protein [Defluviitaleaceae bacterium]|nr:ABC transporter ATP-binding protein [Defluviitaleaceae bacterium]MCL2274394.1 ABC transporter ATP-binding protein [Defluviitaleaceae bacterium]
MSILIARDLTKYYGVSPNQVKALDGVSIAIEAREFVTVVGQSGSGKSTLLHMLGGLDVPTAGEVVIDGHEISGMSEEALTIFRRRNVGFVFQSFNLVPILNVYENIVLPIELDGSTVDTKFVEEILGTLGLAEKRYAMPNQLSGGQQQRVAIARALASKPSIVLADEPTGNLDTKTGQDVLGALKMTAKQFKQTIVMITHNEHIAQLADRVIHIQDGRVKSGGTQ